MGVEEIIYDNQRIRADSIDRGDYNDIHDPIVMHERGIPSPIVPMVSYLTDILKMVPNATSVKIPGIALPTLQDEVVILESVDKEDSVRFTYKVKNKNKRGEIVDSSIAKHFIASTSSNIQVKVPREIIFELPNQVHSKEDLAEGNLFPYMSSVLFDAVELSDDPIMQKLNTLLSNFDFAPIYLGGVLVMPPDGRINTGVDVKYVVSDLSDLSTNKAIAGYEGDATITAYVDDKVNFQAEVSLGFMPKPLLLHTRVLNRISSLDEDVLKVYDTRKQKKKNMLIFGGAGAVGYDVLKQAKEDYNIIVIDKARGHIPSDMNGSHIRLDVTDENLNKKIEQHLNELKNHGVIGDTTVDSVVYALAWAPDVGQPKSVATDESVALANRVSLDPLKSVVKYFNPRKTVAYSAHTDMFVGDFDVYGSMAKSKQDLEDYIIEQVNNGKDMKLIKGGHFESFSFYGILALAMKNNSNIDPLQALLDFRNTEMESFDNKKVTTSYDMAKASMDFINAGEDYQFKHDPIVEVVGDRIGINLRGSNPKQQYQQTLFHPSN